MKQCEFCGASMADDAEFCGKCGRVPSQTAQRATRISDISTIEMREMPAGEDEEQTVLSASGKHLVPRSPSGVLRPLTLVPIEDEDEDEEDEEDERRRAALFGMGLPLFAEVANQPTLGQAPVIQGTPPMAHVPTVAGTPPVQGGSLFSPGSAALHGSSPPLPHIHPPQPLPPPPVRPVHPSGGSPGGSPGGSTGGTTGTFPGCFPLGAILVAAVLIILATTFGLGLTVFAPGLSLSGNSTVTPGGNLALHGQHFLPNSNVTLTLDGGIPLYSVERPSPLQLAERRAQRLEANEIVLYSSLASAQKNVIAVHGDGTFSVTIQISPSWTAGRHTIHASEDVSHRSASLAFTIAQASPTATPTPSPTTGTTPTPTPTATPTPSPTTTPAPTLSCASPGNLSLGSISELSSQTASASVTLCTAGTGTLTWRASWNQNQAPWLKINQAAGTVQAPNQFQVTLSASATKLTAGTYTATVFFTALESNTTQAVNVSLSVKAGCVNATPGTIRFAGVEGISDPDGTQSVTVTNCGLTSNWSASIDNGSSWLSLSATKGTLQGGASRSITVRASNLDAGLKAGTYKDAIVFSIGSDTATINVSLIVQAAPPTITASPGSVNAVAAPCTDSDGTSLCAITLTNNSSSTALTWSDSTNGSGVSVQASSTTIAAGGTEQVTIVVPGGNCGSQVTVTFTAPGNSASVTWNCTLIG